jgi:hypothetical protein
MSAQLCPGPHTVAERLGSTTVLVHTATDRIFELNGTASRLWELVAAGVDPVEARERLLEEYDVDPGTLAAEIERLIADLCSEDFLRIG